MKPTDTIGDDITLYRGDCREVMASLADRSVDAAITDPPYSERTHGMAKTNKGRGHGVKAVSFDSLSDEELSTMLSECGRISRSWVVATLDYQHAFRFDAEPPQRLRSLRIGVWVKPNPMPQISADRPGQGWEAIAFFHRIDAKPKWNGGGRSGVWIHAVAQNQGHPTAKPLPMVREWVRLFTDPGDTILDPFMGSGTTGVAAVREGRKFIGIELDPTHYATALRRLTHAAGHSDDQLFSVLEATP